MSRRSCKRTLFVIAALVVGGLGELVAPRAAHAIIGMPWTPMSYAGVARRTTRRAVMFGGAAAVAPAPGPVVVW
jgi:hypothetical protein